VQTITFFKLVFLLREIFRFGSSVCIFRKCYRGPKTRWVVCHCVGNNLAKIEMGLILSVLRTVTVFFNVINPLNAELNPICHLLALLAHPVLHVSRIRVNIRVYNIRDSFDLLISYGYFSSTLPRSYFSNWR
jgi:hypothetical protein